MGWVNESSRSELVLSPAYRGAWSWEYWDVEPGHRLMQGYWWMSCLISAVYIPLALIAQRLVPRPLNVRWALVLWNTLLAVFSIFGAVRMAPELAYTITHKGLFGSICDASFGREPSFPSSEPSAWPQNWPTPSRTKDSSDFGSICDASFGREAVTGFWTEWFGWSKMAELVDTAFLVLKKRRLTPLHLWHHASVFVFTWHACRDIVASGRWFITMNYTVHGLMYTYFAVQSVGGVKLPSIVPITITSLQILQMLIGVSITGVVGGIKWSGLDCDHTWGNLRFCLIIYASYTLLFLHFFYSNYIRNRRRLKTA